MNMIYKKKFFIDISNLSKFYYVINNLVEIFKFFSRLIQFYKNVNPMKEDCLVS